MPTAEDRKKIWWQHLRTNTIHIPLSENVNIAALSEIYEFCGREIKSTVKSACIATALDNRNKVTQTDLIEACDITREETLKVTSANDHTMSRTALLKTEQQDTLIDAVQQHIEACQSVKSVESLS